MASITARSSWISDNRVVSDSVHGSSPFLLCSSQNDGAVCDNSVYDIFLDDCFKNLFVESWSLVTPIIVGR